MDPAQRGTWLGAGLFVDRDACLPRVVEFVSNGTETRCRHLLEFLVPHLDPLPNQQWPSADLAALIKAIGSKVSSPSDAGGFVLDWKLRPLLNVWLDALANRVDEEAVAVLGGLAEDPGLENWRGALCRARDEQAIERGMSVYVTPTIPEVRKGLKGGPPIGAADLAALVTDKLTHLASRIRDGNTDAWQQYWHTDASDPKGRKVIKPKAEEPCRDALLSDLQLLLEPHEVDALPEGHHAEDARSDIIAIHGGLAVVVEVKKTDSKDLWSAMTDQLIAKYVRPQVRRLWDLFGPLVLCRSIEELAPSRDAASITQGARAHVGRDFDPRTASHYHRDRCGRQCTGGARESREHGRAVSSAEFELGLRLINQHKAIRGEPSQRAIYRGGVSKRNMSTGG